MNTINSYELTQIPAAAEFDVTRVDLDFPTNTFIQSGTQKTEAVYEHFVIEVDGIDGYANVYVYTSIFDKEIIGYQSEICEAIEPSRQLLEDAVINFASSL